VREIDTDLIRQTIKNLFLQASFVLSPEVITAFEKGKAAEESLVGQDIFSRLLENAALAKEYRIPVCQDTGLAVVFVEVGQEVHITGGDLVPAIEEGVRQAYQEGYLRKSVCHPLTRQNTGDNTPAIVHVDIVPGDRLKLVAMPKGGGSENMSRLFMLPPSAGWTGVKERIIQTVEIAGPNACPPLIVGVALGGSYELAPREAKKTLLRPVGQPHPDPEVAALEAELLEAINDTGIGPEGFGGRITALAVNMTIMPCHIASLPLAINFQCHASRHAEAIL